MRKYTLLISSACLLLLSCGKSSTEKKLWDKHWKVYDVTPPPGIFDVEATHQAEDLKNGFYKNAWFQFTRDGVFRASFGGKADSGKYTISFDGKIISLYPWQGTKMYEQLRVLKLTPQQFDFNTILADFRMTLHTRSAE
ncbi:hypothetical protein [Compostibacter hankyongensis]|uniref:Lipocalin-like domain-containing protein n=1 Tax=Compostibacter hankyongensis TaxID=1007089 RepID=A0ABP8G7E1_9BACT